MWPALFRIPLPEFMGGGYFPIRMFGVMVILGFLAGTWIVQRRLSRQRVMGREDAFDFCFYLLASGIVGARLFYVLQNFSDFKGQLGEVFAIWKGGLVWYGGFALATLFAFYWLWSRKLAVLKVTDAVALGLALALAVGRWGCFFAGDDYGRLVTTIETTDDGKPVLGEDGKPVEVLLTDASKAPWWAIQVPKGSTDDWRSQYCETPTYAKDAQTGQFVTFREPHWLHPVQIYMSLKNLAVLAALAVIARRARRTGILTASYLMLYPVARFVVEFWRGDADRGLDTLGTGLSFSQVFGIFVFLFGLMVLRAVKSRPPDVSTSPAVAS